MSPERSPTLVERLNRLGITPVNIVLIYLFVGAGWALYSDLLIETMVKDPVWLERVNRYKDWFFLGGSGVVLWILLQQGMIALQTIRQQSSEIKERQLVAESLRDIMGVLNASIDLDQILETIAVQARKVLRADAISIYQLDPNTEMLTIRASIGLPKDYIAKAKISLGQVATGKAALERVPVPIEDIARIDTQTLAVDAHSQDILDSLSASYQAVLSVPLIGQGDQVQGTITLYYARPKKFLIYDIELATTYGNQAMLALANAALRQQIKDIVIHEERNRLARELHDSVTQTLYSIMLYSDAARMAQQQAKEEILNQHLVALRNMAREALTDMRLLIFELNPPVLEQEGFVNALRSRLDLVEARSGFQVVFNTRSDCNLPAAIEAEIYRITHEALNNVSKHANADKVEITLEQTDTHFCLAIQDNGIGFELDHMNGGWGISNIQERVERMGGTFALNSEPTQGTTLELWIPLPQAIDLERVEGIRT